MLLLVYENELAPLQFSSVRMMGLLKNIADLALGDGRNDPTQNRFIGQLAMRPAVDGSVGVLRFLTGNSQSLRDLLGGEDARSTTARCIAQYLLNGPSQSCVRFSAFDGDQGVK